MWHNTNWGIGDPVKTVRTQELLRIQQPSVILHLAKVESRTRLIKVVAKFIALLVNPMTSFQSLDSSKSQITDTKKPTTDLDCRLYCLWIWSVWEDSNLRPLTPHDSALPGCATYRKFSCLNKLTWLSLSTCYLRCYRVGFTLSDADFIKWIASTQVLSEMSLTNCLVSGLNGEFLQEPSPLLPLNSAERPRLWPEAKLKFSHSISN